MSQITLNDIVNNDKVHEIFTDIQPKFDLLVKEVAMKHQWFELTEALLMVVLTIATAVATHVCDEDYLAARKLIDEILDMIGDPTDGKEGGEE